MSERDLTGEQSNSTFPMSFPTPTEEYVSCATFCGPFWLAGRSPLPIVPVSNLLRPRLRGERPLLSHPPDWVVLGRGAVSCLDGWVSLAMWGPPAQSTEGGEGREELTRGSVSPGASCLVGITLGRRLLPHACRRPLLARFELLLLRLGRGGPPPTSTRQTLAAQIESNIAQRRSPFFFAR